MTMHSMLAGVAAVLALAGCRKPEDMHGRYEGHAELNKDFERVGDSTDQAVVEIEQDGAAATLRVTKASFLDRCTLKGEVKESFGKITGGECVVHEKVAKSGRAETVRVRGGHFYMTGQGIEVELNDDTDAAAEYRLSFNGKKK
jgi:hypothetical protein